MPLTEIKNKKPERAVLPHRLGLIGHFGLDPALLQTARDYGGRILKDNGHFLLNFPQGAGGFDFTGDMEGLRKHLWHLKQPIHNAVREAVTDDLRSGNGKKSGRVLRDNFQSEKILIHRILRYATTGSPTVPPYSPKHLEKDFAACHAETEQKILSDDMWRMTGEIDVKGRVESYDPDKEKKPLEPALIPGSGFDPACGFTFRLAQPLADPLAGESDIPALQGWLSWALHKATNGRYAGQDVQEIALSREEMRNFCRQAHNDIRNHDLETLVNGAAFGERYSEVIARIDTSVASIENAPELRAVVDNYAQSDPSSRLRNLAVATSALSPIIASEALAQRWKHYFFSKRHNAPMDIIVADFELLQAVLRHYNDSETLGSAHLEAIAMDPEFHPAISFAKETSVLLEGALDIAEKKNKKGLSPSAQALRGDIGAMQAAFAKASLGDLSINPDNLPEHYKDVLEVIAMTTGQGGNALTRMGGKFVGNFVDFVKDIYTYPFRGPMEFGVTAASALALHLYMNRGGDSSAANRPVAVGALDEDISGLEDLDSPENLSMVGLPKTEEDLRGGVEGVDWHKHLNPLSPDGYYRHYFNELVTGTAKTFLSMFETTMQFAIKQAGFPGKDISSFMQSANATADAMKPINYLANLAQNYLGHLVYFASMFAKGVQSGPRGLFRLLEHYNGFIDSALSIAKDRPLTLPMMLGGIYLDQIKPKIDGSDMTTGLAFAIIGTGLGYNLSRLWPKRLWPRKEQGPLEFTERLTQNARTMMAAINNETKPENTIPEIASKLGEAAMTYAAIEAKLPANVRPASVSLKYRPGSHKVDNALRGAGIKNTGLNETFTIHAGNLKPALHALQQMDMTLTLFAAQIGAEGKVYQNFVKGKLDAVLNGMIDYQHTRIDEMRLGEILDENLRDVIAAQMHLTKTSPLYESLYGHAPSEKDMARLVNFGAQAQGHWGREERAREAGAAMQRSLENMRGISCRGDALRAGLVDTWSALAHEQIKVTGQNLKISALSAWDMVVDGARAVQHVYGNIPHKKPIAIGLGAVALTATAMDMGGYAGPGHEIINALSLTHGTVAAVTTSTGSLLIVNTADDQIMVHMGMGGTLLLAGSVIYTVNKFGVQPLAGYAAEKARETFRPYRTAKQAAPAPTGPAMPGM